MKEIHVLAIIGIVTLFLLFGGFYFLSKTTVIKPDPNKPINQSILVKDDSLRLNLAGEQSTQAAKVTIVEFGDFQCPACKLAVPIMKSIENKYKGKAVLIVFRHFPLSQHQFAKLAANFSEEAQAEGKFWQAYDKLYETQDIWSASTDPKSLFLKYGEELGLNRDNLKQALETNKYQSKIDADSSDGLKIGVDSTPTFFINGQKVTGVPTEKQLTDLIDNGLK